MKRVILVILLQLYGCGGGITTGTVDTDTGDTDTGTVQVDAGSQDVESKCERACQRFEFTQCLSELMQVLPVGEAIYTSSCMDRCRELLSIYQDLPYEDLNFECLEGAESCPAVAVCLGLRG